jgi:hypothetical protein
LFLKGFHSSSHYPLSGVCEASLLSNLTQQGIDVLRASVGKDVEYGSVELGFAAFEN